MPYGALASGSDCSTLSSFPNDQDADIVISTASHEQLESTTDPNTDAWYFQTISGEIGDECAYNYGTMGLDGGLANEQWNGHYYAVQQEWSNAVTGCSPGVSSGVANDNFASAQALAGTVDTSGTVNGSTVGATKQAGEPTPIGNAGGHSIWYSITPASSGQLRVDTCGSGFDTLLGVYTGSAVNALTTQADNDDSCGQQSSVQFAVTAGTKYSIEVDGYSGDSGAVTLNWWLATNDRIVSVSWSTGEAARLATMGVSLGPIPAAQVQKVSTYIDQLHPRLRVTHPDARDAPRARECGDLHGPLDSQRVRRHRPGEAQVHTERLRRDAVLDQDHRLPPRTRRPLKLHTFRPRTENQQSTPRSVMRAPRGSTGVALSARGRRISSAPLTRHSAG